MNGPDDAPSRPRRVAPPAPGRLERWYRRGVGAAIPLTLVLGFGLLVTARDPGGQGPAAPAAPAPAVLMAEPAAPGPPQVVLRPSPPCRGAAPRPDCDAGRTPEPPDGARKKP